MRIVIILLVLTPWDIGSMLFSNVHYKPNTNIILTFIELLFMHEYMLCLFFFEGEALMQMVRECLKHKIQCYDAGWCILRKQSFAEGIICNWCSLLEPLSNTINKNEVNVEKEGKAKSCYYRFCSRLIPFEEYHPSYKTDGNGVQGISFRFLRRRNLKVKTVFFHKFFFWIVWLPSVRDGL